MFLVNFDQQFLEGFVAGRVIVPGAMIKELPGKVGPGRTFTGFEPGMLLNALFYFFSEIVVSQFTPGYPHHGKLFR